MRIFSTFILLFVFNYFTFAGNLDSLFTELNNAKYDTSKVRLLNLISEKYYNLSIDSSIIYAEKALSLSKKISFKYGVASAFSNIADALFYKGDYNMSIKKSEDAINIFDELNCVKEIIDSYISIGQSWKELGNNPKSLDNLLLALKASEKINDDSRIGKSMISIGVLFLEQRKYNEALQYSKKALKHIVKTNNIAQIANAYARIGNVFGVKQNPVFNSDSVIYYYKKSLELFTEIDHKRGIAVIYNNLAGIYMDQDETDKAIEYYQKAFRIRNKLGDQNGQAIILNNLGNCYKQKKIFDTAILFLNKSLDISLKISKTDMIIDNYDNLSNCYSDKGDYKQALHYKNLFITFKDSLFNDNNSKLITEMQTKYETEKKEKEIKMLNQNKVLSSLKAQQQIEKLNTQKYFIYGVIIVLVIVVSLSFFLLRMYYQKQNANKKLNEQNIEILQQKEEIVAQRDEIETQVEVVTYQKEKIEKIHEEVTSSIRYAQLIQGAVLPSSEQFNEITQDYFILFKPCNIVSGDFYWVTKINDWNLLCVADCTGHGVPGGFMSMLGISFLNEIIRKEVVTNPAEVLNHLREYMISALKQKGVFSDQKDGMDIAFCAYNTNNLKLQFAGAYNPIYIIRSAILNDSEESDSKIDASTELTLSKANVLSMTTALPQNDNIELIEIKGDKMPISFHQRMDNFSVKEYQLIKGDCVYLFSDGYIDQFGGKHSKKFMSKKFKELLLANSKKSMNEQKGILDKTIIEWIGNGVQIDDITVLGFKI